MTPSQFSEKGLERSVQVSANAIQTTWIYMKTIFLRLAWLLLGKGGQPVF
jgi:hypothetical protein